MDILFLNLTSKLKSKEVTPTYRYEISGTEDSVMTVKVAEQSIKVDLLNEKIYDFSKGIFDFEKFERTIKEKCPAVPVYVPSTYRGEAAPINRPKTMQFPCIPLEEKAEEDKASEV